MQHIPDAPCPPAPVRRRRTRPGALALAGLCAALPLALATPADAYSGEVYTVCRLDPAGDNFLALRDCGSSDCAMIARLDPGTFLWTLNPTSEGKWRWVTVMDGIQDEIPIHKPTGYVYDHFICRVDFRGE